MGLHDQLGWWHSLSPGSRHTVEDLHTTQQTPYHDHTVYHATVLACDGVTVRVTGNIVFQPTSTVQTQSVLHMIGLRVKKQVMNIHEEWVWPHMDRGVGGADVIPVYGGREGGERGQPHTNGR